MWRIEEEINANFLAMQTGRIKNVFKRRKRRKRVIRLTMKNKKNIFIVHCKLFTKARPHTRTHAQIHAHARISAIITGFWRR